MKKIIKLTALLLSLLLVLPLTIACKNDNSNTDDVYSTTSTGGSGAPSSTTTGGSGAPSSTTTGGSNNNNNTNEEIYADVAGTYTAKVFFLGSLEFDAKIVLDAFGRYEYVSTDPAQNDAVQYEETGTFTVEGGKIVLTPSADGATSSEGTITDSTITTRLKVSNMLSAVTTITFSLNNNS